MRELSTRRQFIRDGVLLAAGAAAGSVFLSRRPMLESTRAQDQRQGAQAERRIEELGIELPPVPKPVAVYVPAVRVDDMLYASGHGPRQADGNFIQGKVGRDLTLDEGYAAARLVGLNVLSTVRAALGSLDHVERLVKVLGMVNSTAEFTKHPQVVNGFSELMVQVFGERAGKAARSAVGMGSLPSNIPVEIEAIFQVRRP